MVVLLSETSIPFVIAAIKWMIITNINLFCLRRFYCFYWFHHRFCNKLKIILVLTATHHRQIKKCNLKIFEIKNKSLVSLASHRVLSKISFLQSLVVVGISCDDVIISVFDVVVDLLDFFKRNILWKFSCFSWLWFLLKVLNLKIFKLLIYVNRLLHRR